MKTYLIRKQHHGQLVAQYRVTLPERQERHGYRQQTSLNAFIRQQPLLRQNGYTWASVTPVADTTIPSPPQAFPVNHCNDVWDFYRQSHWDYKVRAFVGLGDWW